jgi:hypothetical protein
MNDEVPFDATQMDEFTIGDGEPLPFPYVRQSRLVFPKGPLNKNWLMDQIYLGTVRSALLIPRDKFHGVRVVHLQSVLELIERLAQAPGADPSAAPKG